MKIGDWSLCMSVRVNEHQPMSVDFFRHYFKRKKSPCSMNTWLKVYKFLKLLLLNPTLKSLFLKTVIIKFRISIFLCSVKIWSWVQTDINIYIYKYWYIHGSKICYRILLAKHETLFSIFLCKIKIWGWIQKYIKI